ncbi:MAG: hypothetical protein R3298_02950 [Gammaproteobacteria bacterium]|nr:hypothetical protein [Gammaproteobacteria bacterium]
MAFESGPRIPAILLLLFALGTGGCAGMQQTYSTTSHENLALQVGDLERHGIAFIGTLASTGREEDRQALALLFAQVLRERYPQLRVVSLSETLGKINDAGLADPYVQMYEEYRATGLLRRDTLDAIGGATGTRYLAQLRLSAFDQQSSERFGAIGFRIVMTKIARVRLYFQIWDRRTGGVVWEGVEELIRSDETARESLVTFQSVVEAGARNLIDRLPRALAGAPAAETTGSVANPDGAS